MRPLRPHHRVRSVRMTERQGTAEKESRQREVCGCDWLTPRTNELKKRSVIGIVDSVSDIAQSGFMQLEQRVRLSESSMYELMKEYYAQKGMDAWNTSSKKLVKSESRADCVPFYITSNPSIAMGYARTIVSYVADLKAAVDTNHPFYIVELGTGPGKFSLLFLTLFTDLLREYQSSHLISPELKVWRNRSPTALG